jgi:hypothetical protein
MNEEGKKGARGSAEQAKATSGQTGYTVQQSGDLEKLRS